jgi:integration host factor subunit alpha
LLLAHGGESVYSRKHAHDFSIFASGVMTKAEIVQALYTKVGGFSKKESADMVDLVFEMMKETLGRGEKIKISGFGNFVLRDKRQRPGRNPQTGEPIKISERRVLTFKASQILKQALNPRNGAPSAGSNGQPGTASGGGSGSPEATASAAATTQTQKE